jgi:hypothetical protein
MDCRGSFNGLFGLARPRHTHLAHGRGVWRRFRAHTGRKGDEGERGHGDRRRRGGGGGRRVGRHLSAAFWSAKRPVQADDIDLRRKRGRLVVVVVVMMREEGE